MARKPKHMHTVAEALAKVREGGRREICAGLPLQMERLMYLMGYSEAELARQTGWSQSYIGEVRDLEKFPSVEWWDGIANCFEMLIEDFISESRLILRGDITL